MSFSKEFLVDKYNAVKLCTRHEPSVREFCKKTGITSYDLQKSFGCNWWSKLVRASGDKPKTFSVKRRTNEEFLTDWGRFIRKIKKIPRQADWHFCKFKPTAGTYSSRFGGLANISKEFRKFAGSKPGWRDVITILDKEKPEAPQEKPEYLYKKDVGENYKDYIPNILNDFEFVSKTASEKFENGAALIYQLLGFDVVKLGKEKSGKREPDGIAYNKGSYAIIYDSKSRKDGYCIRTDDRRVIEYIKKYRDRIKREGCGKIYFQIISSRFKGNPAKAVRNIKKETQVQLSLIKADDLLKILSKKIEIPLGFSLNKFELLLLENGIIKTSKIDNLLTEID